MPTPPTENSDPAILLEQALIAYARQFKETGSSLQPFEFYPGHGEVKKEDGPHIIITASNLGGPLAYAGNFDADVLMSVNTSADDAGMVVHSPAVRTLMAIFAQSNDQNADNHAVVVAWLNTFPGLGCSAFDLDPARRTQEARDPATRQHGTAIPYKFSVHLRAA